MRQKLVKSITTLSLLILLLFDINLIVCQNITNNNNNKTTDDYVYDYGSGDNENITTDTPKTTEAKSSTGKEVNDDYVYDYGSGAKDNTSTTVDDLDIKPNVYYDDESDKSTESTGAESVTSSGDSSTTDSEDLGYDDETSTDGSCDNESLLTKLLNLHEENKNITNDYLIKNVNHINDTFDRLRYVQGLYEKYFQQDKNFGTQLLAFVSSIDIILTPECFASFFSLISGLRNNKLWANKCEFYNIFY